MKLFASPTSPFSRKVRVVLLEKKIECDIAFVNPWTQDPDLQAANPLGKVPVLVLDDGGALYDSRVIVDHVDHASPVNRLLPADKRAQTQIKRLEALADGICDAAILAMLESRRPRLEQSQTWQNIQLDKVKAGIAALAEELDDKAWLRDNFSLADIAVFCALDWLNLRFTELNWAAQFPNLAQYHARLSQRSSFIETSPMLTQD